MFIIDGKQISKDICKKLKEEVALMKEIPGLGIILVGERKDSQTYVRMKKKACEDIGIYNRDILLSDTVSEDEVMTNVEILNKDPKIHGILVQLPLPKHINEERVLKAVKLEKDVDGTVRPKGGFIREKFNADQNVRLKQGYLETSNVSVFDELVNNTEIQKQYQLNVKLIALAKEMDEAGSALMRLPNN